MDLVLFNTLTKQKELFIPIDKNKIGMYVCGPTVYDRPHLGNARSVVVYDLLYRILIRLYGIGNVVYVRNITDIDDKIINRAQAEQIPIHALTQQTINYFHEDMQYLYCLSPNFEPRATDHVQDIIDLITRLLARGYAYQAFDHIYFDTTKFPDYLVLSGQSLVSLYDSVRKEASLGKKSAADFVLWKPASQNDLPTSIYESPFGAGRPGWHIECSAMSHKFLGDTFDIHGGGLDLIFPHHTNEIAQSCCAFDNARYAKTWVHNGFLTVNHQKMSKSLNNFLTVKDLIDKGIHGEVIRLLLLSNSYRTPLDFNDKALSDAQHTLNYWYQAIASMPVIQNTTDAVRQDIDHTLPNNFLIALLDDINTSKAIVILNEYAKIIHTAHDAHAKFIAGHKLIQCAQFIGLLNHSSQEWFACDADLHDVELLIQQRKNAKDHKDWLLADQIRHNLAEMGIQVEDHANGTSTWKKYSQTLNTIAQRFDHDN